MGFLPPTSFIGNGSGITGIVTNLVAGDNISLNNSTGTVTITGLAKTDRINAESLVVSGVSTFTGQANFGLVSIGNTVSIGDTLYSDDIRVGGDLRLNVTGSQFFAFNEDTVKVKFAGGIRLTIINMVWVLPPYYETFFAANGRHRFW